MPVASASAPRAGEDAAPPPSATEVWQPVPPKVDVPAGGVPSDATVLFAGSDTDAWEHAEASEDTDTRKMDDGRPIGWKVMDGALVVTPGSGDIRTREAFGDVQLHLEFRTLAQPTGDGQGASNSGVFLMERYELQVLDSYRNATYVNGQAASVYKQHAPLVNASRPPGEWQSYDVLFLAPRFAADGRVLAPARMTVFHNGVLVQHDVALRGSTVYQGQPEYEAHAARQPLRLQDHGDPVAFRNIWIRAIARPVSQ
ncbi:3-keto-disaccharide hydrolase [Luteimonas suaedae]|uniref:3-keto-disaccharide hydrolase n=1 Tax=Luteimonas suaedae TaxID=2605430 RepID=UPI002103A730|nr:DUF1080 domain-containing protein [Luteimonas suaedae]